MEIPVLTDKERAMIKKQLIFNQKFRNKKKRSKRKRASLETSEDEDQPANKKTKTQFPLHTFSNGFNSNYIQQSNFICNEQSKPAMNAHHNLANVPPFQPTKRSNDNNNCNTVIVGNTLSEVRYFLSILDRNGSSLFFI
jgi:hypothetical protein